MRSVVPVREDSCCPTGDILTGPMSSAVNPLRRALAVRDSLPISRLKLPVRPPVPSPAHTFISRRCPAALKISSLLTLCVAFSVICHLGRVRSDEGVSQL